MNKNSIHLQNFPDVSFIKDETQLVADIDLVREICSAALAIRDNKNLRVRLPLASLTIIKKNAIQFTQYQEIIAEEVNVKKIIFEEKSENFAAEKLQLNFKKIGAKYGSKVKEITAALKENAYKKIADNKIEIAGIELENDEFEIKVALDQHSNSNFVLAAIPSFDCLIKLNIEITPDLENEGVARDIVRAVQQSRKDADLNISNKIKLKISSKNSKILQIAKDFAEYIKEQVLASSLETSETVVELKKNKFFFETKIEDGDLAIAFEI